MKRKTKRSKSSAQKAKTSAARQADSPNFEKPRPTVSFGDETAPKTSHEEWQVKPFVGRLFSTEVPDLDDEADTKQAKKAVPRRPVNKQPPVREQGKQRPIFSNVRHNDRGKINIDRECDSKVGSANSANYERWQRRVTAGSDNHSPQITRHRPTLSVKVDADYFVPKAHRRKTYMEAKREKISLKRDKTNQNEAKADDRRGEIPLSVISEIYQDSIHIPRLPDEELYSFGDVYEDNLFHLIHKYLEVDTFHRVAYVGSEHSSLAPQLEDYFCLTEPVQSVFPGKVDYKDIKEKSKLLAFKIANVGAEEFFAQAANDAAYKSAPFDRIIIHDAVQYFNDLESTLSNIMKTLHEFGKLLIVHRPGALNTLPYFTEAKNRICESDVPYMQIIGGLQKFGADVEWDLVHVPIVMPATKWLAMLKAKFPPQMEIMSTYEIACGIRELSEGPLKYLGGDVMEIEDRLMFITASHATFDCAFPAVQRVGGSSQVPYSGLADIQYKLELTKDMEAFLPKSKASQYQMKSLF